MADPGTLFTDKRQALIESRLRKVYGDAQKTLKRRLKEHTDKYKAKDKIKRQQVKDGTLTQGAYESWVQGQVFIGQQWKDKIESVNDTIRRANQTATDIVNGERRAVFGENVTYQAYQLEHDAGMNLSFNVYDSAAVTRLINEHPELMKRRKIDGVEQKAWNKALISDTIAKAIITGESIDRIADEIAEKTALSNAKASVRYARTSMTAAQNAGRISMLHEAQDMGIKVKKQWLATLDSRTRDSHASIDGEVKEVDEEFSNGLQYPGDPNGSAAEVWNCRCTLIYKYDEYPMQNVQRYDQENGELIENMTYKEWKEKKSSSIGANIKKAAIGWANSTSEVLPQTFDTDIEMFDIAGFQRIKGPHTFTEDLWLTNPDFDPANPETSENCQRCVLAYVARRRGFDVEAQRIYNLYSDDLMLNYGWKRVFDGEKGFVPIFNITDRDIKGTGIRDNIINVVKNSDNGAIYVVDVEWEAILGMGHVFIAENHNGEVVFLDPQDPSRSQESVWERIKPRSTRLFRVDDKPFNAGIMKGVKARND